MRSLLPAAALLAAALPVAACPPPPLPPEQEAGESDQAYRARLERIDREKAEAYRRTIIEQQTQRWERSPRVFIGRIEKARSRPTGYDSRGLRVLVRPIRWFRGQGKDGPFWIKRRIFTSCGGFGGGDAVEGRPGQLFLFFAEPGRLRSKSVIDSVGEAMAMAPPVVEALAAAKANLPR